MANSPIRRGCLPAGTALPGNGPRQALLPASDANLESSQALVPPLAHSVLLVSTLKLAGQLAAIASPGSSLLLGQLLAPPVLWGRSRMLARTHVSTVLLGSMRILRPLRTARTAPGGTSPLRGRQAAQLALLARLQHPTGLLPAQTALLASTPQGLGNGTAADVLMGTTKLLPARLSVPLVQPESMRINTD